MMEKTTRCQYILIVLFTSGLMSFANTQNDIQPSSARGANNRTSENTGSGPISTTPVIVKCGNTQKMVDECFKDLPPHLMEFLQKTKITINEQEIESKCTVFHRGMKCFDEYTARCLSNRKINMFQNNVEGARKFFIKFCGDREFQKDYLRHKDCFSYIQEDWLRCTKNFQNILTEELHLEQRNVTHKFMEFCCARHAYENCIYNSARYKCYKHSAKFARDTAKMLSEEKHFTNCRQYEQSLCNAGHMWHPGRWPWPLASLLLLLLMPLIEFMRP